MDLEQKLREAMATKVAAIIQIMNLESIVDQAVEEVAHDETPRSYIEDRIKELVKSKLEDLNVDDVLDEAISDVVNSEIK